MRASGRIQSGWFLDRFTPTGHVKLFMSKNKCTVILFSVFILLILMSFLINSLFIHWTLGFTD